MDNKVVGENSEEKQNCAVSILIYDSEDEISNDPDKLQQSNTFVETLKQFYDKNNSTNPTHLQAQPSTRSLNSSTESTSHNDTILKRLSLRKKIRSKMATNDTTFVPNSVSSKQNKRRGRPRKTRNNESIGLSNTNELQEESNLKDYLHKTVKCKYAHGDVVWARINGYSYWPAMIDKDPDIDMYFWTENFAPIPTHYHVVFFDAKNRLSRSWCRPSQIRPYGVGKVTISEKHFTQYKNRFRESVKKADEALKMSIEARLRNFSFARRMKKPGILLCQD